MFLDLLLEHLLTRAQAYKIHTIIQSGFKLHIFYHHCAANLSHPQFFVNFLF